MTANSSVIRRFPCIAKLDREFIIILIGGFVTIALILLGFAAQSVTVPEQSSFFTFESPEEVKIRLITQTIVSYNPRLSRQQKAAICHTIIAEASANKFDPLFISGVIAAESSFHPRAVSRCEALGLMQITAGVIEIMGIDNPFDIRENIYAGTRYLRDLRGMFGKFDLILAAYNAGPSRVAKLGRIPRIDETIHYVRRVTRNYQRLQQQFQAMLRQMNIKPASPDIFRSAADREPADLTVQTQKTPQNPLKPGVIDLDNATYKVVIRPKLTPVIFQALEKRLPVILDMEWAFAAPKCKSSA